MELHFLGTGAGVPSKRRNTSAIALKFLNYYKGALWLFDCGEATQHQVLQTTLKLAKLEKIFITHLHGDHLFGLPGLLGSRSFQGGESPLTIYGPKGIKHFVDATLATSKTALQYDLSIIEIEDGMVLDVGDHYVKIKQLDHGIHSYGYRIEEKERQGPLLIDKLKQHGVQPGPLYKRIKEGKNVKLEDGRLLIGKDFVGPAQEGKVLVILGDTRYCEASFALATEADVLVHEATFMAKDHKLAHDYFHSTSVEAATIAQKAAVKKLILTHISSRYQKKELTLLLDEARTIFPDSFLASDFSMFTIS